MMRTARIVSLALALLVAWQAAAAIAPGFAIRKVAATSGFLTEIAFDRGGVLHYSTLAGGVYRLSAGTSALVATVPTALGSNEGLLGIAFLDDGRLAVHHNRVDHTADLISIVDTTSGAVTPLAELPCNRGNPCSSEHHGGHVAVAPDGSLYVGIGDCELFTIAQDPSSPCGKIVRVFPDGTWRIHALGFRNPFGVAYDAMTGKVIVADNGPGRDDRVDLVAEGENAGWPATAITPPGSGGFLVPLYLFPTKIAPTGICPLPGGGLLVGSFTTKAIYLFTDIHAMPVNAPMTLVVGETESIIAVARNAHGEIFFGTASAIYQLVAPARRHASRPVNK